MGLCAKDVKPRHRNRVNKTIFFILIKKIDEKEAGLK
jgi:hypothetical protein